MKRILVCEDEDAIRDFVVINLVRSGYDVVDVSCGEDAVKVYTEQNGNFDVALLDIMMPGMDGFALCRWIREQSSEIGIIMLSAKSQEMDKVNCLMIGADDYVTKPFSPSELVARVDAIYRRVNVTQARQDTVKNIFGAFTIFTDKPFGIGDTINVNGLEGTVIDVGMRSTRILGYDRRITSYPNYKITDASIVNISSEPMRRAMVKLGLTYDTGAEKMKQALEILRAIPAKIKDVSGNPSDVTAYFSDYTDSALVVTFYYYIEKQGDVLKTTSDVNLEILDSFAKAGLTFAFPTRTLLVHQDDAEKAGGEPAAADGTQIQNS